MSIPPLGNLLYKGSTNHDPFPLISQPPHLYYHQNKLLLSSQAMDLSPLHPSWQYLYPSHLLFPYQFTPENYVHWTQNPESHVFSADLPGKPSYNITMPSFPSFLSFMFYFILLLYGIMGIEYGVLLVLFWLLWQVLEKKK